MKIEQYSNHQQPQFKAKLISTKDLGKMEKILQEEEGELAAGVRQLSLWCDSYCGANPELKNLIKLGTDVVINKKEYLQLCNERHQHGIVGSIKRLISNASPLNSEEIGAALSRIQDIKEKAREKTARTISNLLG